MNIKDKITIAMIGTGYVGLVTSACYAKSGFKTYCVDIVQEKIDALKAGIIPIYEENLEPIVKDTMKNGLLIPTTDLRLAVTESNIIMLCVQTPGSDSGAIDLSTLIKAAEQIAQIIKGLNDHKTIVVRSSVPPGTASNVIFPIFENTCSSKNSSKFSICNNPEFLKEGSAVDDFENPDRIVIGGYDEVGPNMIRKLYVNSTAPILITTLEEAEMIKYGSNCYLATRISYINEIAAICQKQGIDIKIVKDGIGFDSRIGQHFFNPGPGYGGSCLPKDVQGLAHHAQQIGLEPHLLIGVAERNNAQMDLIFELINKSGINFKNRKIAILGAAFKPNTDDVRKSSSLALISILIDQGYKNITLTDPMALDNAKQILGESYIHYERDVTIALQNADLCILMTAWDVYLTLKPIDFVKTMTEKVVIDSRRLYDVEEMKKNDIKYFQLGVG